MSSIEVLSVRDDFANARPVDDFLPPTGEMADAIRAVDWSATSLGARQNWPQSLKTITRLVLSSKQPMCFWWGADLICFHNDAYVPILGQRADRALARPFREVWADVWDDVLPLVTQALSGDATWCENLPLTMTRNGYDEATHWTFSYSPLHGDDGAVAGILNIVTEMTKAVADRAALETANASLARSNAEARLLQNELSHRMKNTLAMVQAIVSQTMRHSSSIREAGDIISSRLIALSRAQNILTKTSWTSADLRDVIEDALCPHRDDDARISVSGPPTEITAEQALGISLAINELATNAAKYGALSNATGAVSVKWATGADGRFQFEWLESGGPPVVAPERRGFGSRLLENIVGGYFSGTSRITHDAAGVGFVLNGQLTSAAMSLARK